MSRAPWCSEDAEVEEEPTFHSVTPFIINFAATVSLPGSAHLVQFWERDQSCLGL